MRVGDDGTVPLREGERVNVEYLASNHPVGETMAVKILRAGKVGGAKGWGEGSNLEVEWWGQAVEGWGQGVEGWGLGVEGWGLGVEGWGQAVEGWGLGEEGQAYSFI